MQPIDKQYVQEQLNGFVGENPVYLHLETTTGSYTALEPGGQQPVVAFIRNTKITFSRATINGDGYYRVGLKMPDGWVYANGLTHHELNERQELLLHGIDDEGNLTVALQLALQPFRED